MQISLGAGVMSFLDNCVCLEGKGRSLKYKPVEGPDLNSKTQ